MAVVWQVIACRSMVEALRLAVRRKVKQSMEVARAVDEDLLS